MLDSNNKQTRRRFLEATGSAAGALALAGCMGGSDTQGSGNNGGGNQTANSAGGSNSNKTGNRDGNAANDGGQGTKTLQLTTASISTLDPVAGGGTSSTEVMVQMYDGLMSWPEGQVPVVGKIAEDYTVSEDFTTYTFTLKQGVTFHNGKEVTANDFAYSWRRIAGSANSLVAGDILDTVGVKHETTADGSYKTGTLAVEAVDKYTFRFTVEQPFHATLQVIANNQFAAIPENIVGDIPGYKGEMSYSKFSTKNPIGAGPFEFDFWKQGTEVQVKAYENYYDTGPRLAGIHWQILENDSAIYNYAMNRNVDLFTMPTQYFSRSKANIERVDKQGRKFGTYGPLRNGETVNYLSVPTLSISYMGFNMQTVPRPVRQAIAYAMNQQTIVEQVFKGRAVPAYHYTIPAVYPGGKDAYRQHAKSQYPYGYGVAQIEKARQVMEKAGYGPNNRFELEFLLYQSKPWLQTAKLLRTKLASAHIDISISQARFSTMLTRVRRMNVEAYSLGWVVPWAAVDGFVKHLNPKKSWPKRVQAAEAFNNWPLNSDSAKQAIEGWNRIQNNPRPTKSDRQARHEAAIQMEEANWGAVANLPVFHERFERFWYQNVDVQPFGIGGAYKQKFEEARKQ